MPLQTLLAIAKVPFEEDSSNWADIEFKYAGYLTRERSAAARLAQMEELLIPERINYGELASLSFEAREKLDVVRPQSLGQASRIPGITPNDLQGLVVEVLRLKNSQYPVSRETRDRAHRLKGTHYV